MVLMEFQWTLNLSKHVKIIIQNLLDENKA